MPGIVLLVDGFGSVVAHGLEKSVGVVLLCRTALITQLSAFHNNHLFTRKHNRLITQVTSCRLHDRIIRIIRQRPGRVFHHHVLHNLSACAMTHLRMQAYVQLDLAVCVHFTVIAQNLTGIIPKKVIHFVPRCKVIIILVVVNLVQVRSCYNKTHRNDVLDQVGVDVGRERTEKSAEKVDPRVFTRFVWVENMAKVWHFVVHLIILFELFDVYLKNV